jgi:hypothetical protein
MKVGGVVCGRYRASDRHGSGSRPSAIHGTKIKGLEVVRIGGQQPKTCSILESVLS